MHTSELTADDAVILLQQAAVWHRDGDVARAETACRDVLAADPGHPDALNLLAMALHARGESATAATLLKRAARIEQTARSWSNLGVVLSSSRDYVGGVAAYRQAVLLEPLNVLAWTNLLYAIDHHPYVTPAMRRADRQAFDSWHCAALTAAAPPHEHDPDPERRLRIGYVSADFRNHSAAMAFGPVLYGHDRERFEVFCYDQWDGAPDQVTVRLQQAADTWRSIVGMSDEAVARQIRADQIDILVDLSGYSNGGRLLVFARRPAPIQITGWGHGTGTGLACMDYLISDAVTIPPEHEGDHAEQILRLPCALAFDATPPWPEVTAPPAERNGFVTFGNLGRGSKLNEQTLSAWATILRRLPTARLLLKSASYSNPTLREWLLSVLAALGVTPDRVTIRGSTTRMDHLATYGEIDVHLDTFPHGGGITVFEACLMGVPTVTLLGNYASARIGAAILSVVGDAGIPAASADAYIDQAMTEVALLPHTLVNDRLAVRQSLLISVLCDELDYAAAAEDAYRACWRQWCAGKVGEYAATI